MPRDVPDVASWNVFWTNGAADIRRGMAAIMKTGADIICTQEMSDDPTWEAIAQWTKTVGWWTTPKNNAIPIHVDLRTYEVLEWKSVLFDKHEVVEPGAGGTSFGPKSIMRVTVRHRVDGSVSHHFNTHLIPTFEKAGKVGTFNPLRFAHANRHVQALIDLAKPCIESGDPVTASADWNVSSSTGGGAWLRGLMGPAGFRSAQHELGPYNTHGTREIDDIFFANAVATRFRRLEKFGSDHSPIQVDLGPRPKDEPQGEPTVPTWRLAPTLVQLRKEVNENYPLRDKTSDGTLGNASHAASKSDHNPDSRGVVCAVDLDEDLQGSAAQKYPRFNPGQAARALVDRLLDLATAGKLPQLYYIIYEGKIYSRSYGFRAIPYKGANPHDHHVHVSVYHSAKHADRTEEWGVEPPRPKPTLDYKMLVAGINDPSEPSGMVKAVQEALNRWRGSLHLVEDGYWGVRTKNGYATFQSWKYDVPVGHPDADGVPGPQSLGALGFNVINV